MAVVKVTFQELTATASQLHSAAANIQQESSNAQSKVQALVGAGWEGAASEQFAALMQEWNSGAAKIQDALTQISGLLNKASAAYQQTEDAVKSSMS